MSECVKPNCWPVDSEQPEWISIYRFDGEMSADQQSLVKKHFSAEAVKGVLANKQDAAETQITLRARGGLGAVQESLIDGLRPLIGQVITNRLISVTLIPVVDIRQPIDEGLQLQSHVRQYDITLPTKQAFGLDA